MLIPFFAQRVSVISLADMHDLESNMLFRRSKVSFLSLTAIFSKACNWKAALLMCNIPGLQTLPTSELHPAL